MRLARLFLDLDFIPLIPILHHGHYMHANIYMEEKFKLYEFIGCVDIERRSSIALV